MGEAKWTDRNEKKVDFRPGCFFFYLFFFSLCLRRLLLTTSVWHIGLPSPFLLEASSWLWTSFSRRVRCPLLLHFPTFLGNEIPFTEYLIFVVESGKRERGFQVAAPYTCGFVFCFLLSQRGGAGGSVISVRPSGLQGVHVGPRTSCGESGFSSGMQVGGGRATGTGRPPPSARL